MTHAIAGVLPVVHMPYTESGAIDLATMGKQIDYLFEVGADGFCLALVSDLFRLSEQERTALPAQLCSFAQQRGPIVINVAAESTQQAQIYARAAEDGGAAALMAIPPISRALGDLNALRCGLIPTTEVYSHTVRDEDKFIILASDGVWYARDARDNACDARRACAAWVTR